MKLRVVIGPILAAVLATIGGCAREPAAHYEPSAAVAKLDPKFQKDIREVLEKRCGTPAAPILLGQIKRDRGYLRQGAAVYARNCRQCHGVSGDGKGPAASHMLPRPRDYRPGIFKFTSTTYGSKPIRDDLVRTVKRGISGTSMPSFKLLPQRDLEAVVDYVLSLTHRGELESQLADAVEFDGQIDRNGLPAMVDGILAKWKAARGQVVFPQTPMPEFTSASVRAGKEAFLTKGCSKCHSEDGRGETKEGVGLDAWGNATKPADLTSGMLRGGTEPLDVYRHIDAGINGTPMPSFHDSLGKEPATMWDLAAYVLYLSNRRREGDIPDAGMLKPLPGVGGAPAAASKTALRPRAPIETTSRSE